MVSTSGMPADEDLYRGVTMRVYKGTVLVYSETADKPLVDGGLYTFSGAVRPDFAFEPALTFSESIRQHMHGSGHYTVKFSAARPQLFDEPEVAAGLTVLRGKLTFMHCFVKGQQLEAFPLNAVCSVGEHTISASFSDEIPLRSPRKLCIFIT